MMKNLKLLLKIKWTSLWKTSFASKNSSGKTTSTGKKILFGLLAIYLVGVMAVLFGVMSWMIISEMKSFGLEWLSLAIGAIAAVALCFITMIFTMQSQIFGAKDNDLLLAMPIRPSTIAASRVLSLLLLEYVYNAVVLIPTGVVYVMLMQPSWYFYPMFIIGFLLLPLLPLALAGVMAYILAAISSKVKYKNLIVGLLSCAFFAVYMYACMNLQQYMLLLVQKGAEIAGAIQNALPPIYHFANMASTGSIWSLVVVSLWCILPIAAFLCLMSKGMAKYSTASKGMRSVYKKRKLKRSKPLVAIFRKDASKFLNTTTYLFNTAFAIVLMVGFSVYIAIKGPAMLGPVLNIPELMQLLPQIALVFLCFIVGISCTTAPSISLEGINIWILKSMPISPLEIFRAKIMLNLTVTVPAVILSVLVCASAFNLDLISIAILILVPSALSLFVALTGLYVNLCFPRMDYPSDAHAVKQGMSVMIMSFGGMGIVAVPALLYLYFLKNMMSFNMFAIGLFVVLLLACFAIWQLLKRDGVRRFEAI